MSSRALRRLERAKAMADDSDHSDEETVPVQAKTNAFALLNGSDDEDSSDNDSEQPETAEPEPAEPEPTVVEPPKRSQKKSKKGRKQKEEMDDDDLDKFLEEVKKRDLATRSQSPATQSPGPAREDLEAPYDEHDIPINYTDSNFLYFTTARLKSCLHLLSIKNAKNLDPDTELKNLFGNLSLETIEDANSTTSLAVSPEVLAQFRKLARLTRGWGGKDHRSVPGTSRKLLFTRIKDDWLPTAQKLLAMEDLTTESVVDTKLYKEEDADYHTLESKVKNEEDLGIRYFSFSKISSVHERVANSRFYASVVMTPDPESLMQLLQQHPYHVETLLQVAMVMLRQGNNKATSNALVEKALFVFDRSLGKRFHEILSSGKSELLRLPYETFANRQFYLTLFRVITGLAERSTHYTALTYSKLLLSLSPAEDPLGVRYFIDHYAILSEEYQFLVNFVESALVQTYKTWYTPGLAFSHVLALLHLKKTQEAKKALKNAFSAHPYCALQLLSQVGLVASPPAKSEEVGKNEYTDLVTETYLVRASVLWSDQAHKQFLHDELLKLFEEWKTNNKESFLWKWWGKGKEEEKMPIPVNLVRFVILAGENKLLAKVPEKILEMDDMFEYDVKPPKDQSRAYDVFRGADGDSKVTDSLFDYLDHNIISAIVQNRSGAEFEEFLGLDDAVDQEE